MRKIYKKNGQSWCNMLFMGKDLAVEGLERLGESPVRVFKEEKGVIIGFAEQIIQVQKEFDQGSLCRREFSRRIGELEIKFGQDLKPEEKAVLSLFSQMFSLVSWKGEIGDLENVDQEQRTGFMQESVMLQQEVVKMVTDNIDLEKMEFSRPLARYFLFLTDVFGDLMASDCVDMTENSRLVEGIRGMVTSAFLFKKIGWEVSLPPVDHDVFYGVDLMVRNPETGRYYAVDVTASLHGKNRGEDVFELKRVAPHSELRGVGGWKDVHFLRLNVPPIKNRGGGLLSEARASYVSRGGIATRALGIPNEDMVKKFVTMLQKAV